MSEQPEEEYGPAEEVEVNFEPDDIGIKITATLGEATVTVEHAWEAADEATFLVRALPNILAAVQDALESQEAQQ